MGKRVTEPLALGGQYSAGDAGSIPDGTVRLLQNYLPRPNRIPSRPPFTYDNMMNVNGLTEFNDQASKVSRLVAIDTTHHLFTKSATLGSEIWGSANATTISGTRLSSSANYRGKTYMMFDNGTAGLPTGAAVYDGTNISTSPFKSIIVARTAAIFNERLHLSYPRLTIPVQTTKYDAYQWPVSLFGSSATLEVTLNNVTFSSLAIGSATVGRLFPTSLLASACSVIIPTQSTGFENFLFTATSAETGRKMVLTQSLRAVDAINKTPITLEINVGARSVGVLPQAVVLGAIEDRLGYLFRVTKAGTVNGAEPAWTTTKGAVSTWGTADFTNIGTTVIGSSEFFHPNATDSPDSINYYVTGLLPDTPSSTTLLIGMNLKFYNSAQPALTVLAPIDISYKDGLTDGDPRKANWGMQMTLGDNVYPFFNQESSTTATVDLEQEIWSEVGLPDTFLSASTYKLTDSAGFPTAACVASGRKFTFKRTAFWQFQGVDDASTPIRRERLLSGVGCIGSLALEVFEDVIYFIGENDIYSYSIGYMAEPVPICGVGMREEIMNKDASSWVESQATYNRPLLAIDQTNLIMWVYTQNGKLYAYDLRAKMWSTHVVGSGLEVAAMLWNRNTGNFYVSFGGFGLTRMMYSGQGKDTVDNTATELPIVKVFIPKSIELSSPSRFDAYCEGVQILYRSSGGQAVELAISDNQGATYPNTVDYTPVSVSTDGDFVPMTLDVCQLGNSATLKLTATGETGEAAWTLSPRAHADVEVMTGEYPQVNPTPGASNL